MVISVDENPSSTVVEGAASVISVPNDENVRDETALPLLSDLCEKAVLAYSPCFAFSLLPGDLKLKILQLLPSIDVARFGRVSSELRFLCSNNDLWKQKIGEEFTESEYSRWASKSLWAENEDWKQAFILCWKLKKKYKRLTQLYMDFPRRNRDFRMNLFKRQRMV